ncbi:hypothetical protein HOY82DRAFT_541723 [Tuber indicum]|nr:hypothetical protein HOY82DRAFT_541723 [Tuber indicum]
MTTHFKTFPGEDPTRTTKSHEPTTLLETPDPDNATSANEIHLVTHIGAGKAMQKEETGKSPKPNIRATQMNGRYPERPVTQSLGDLWGHSSCRVNLESDTVRNFCHGHQSYIIANAPDQDPVCIWFFFATSRISGGGAVMWTHYLGGSVSKNHTTPPPPATARAATAQCQLKRSQISSTAAEWLYQPLTYLKSNAEQQSVNSRGHA